MNELREGGATEMADAYRRLDVTAGEGTAAPAMEAERVSREVRAAAFATQIGPVMTTALAEKRARDNRADYALAKARYPETDWAPTA